MKKAIKIIFLVLSALIIIVLMAVLLFSYLGGPITTKSDIARMQKDIDKYSIPEIYTNSEYGFEIKYPSHWKENWSSNAEYKKAGLTLTDENNEFYIGFNSFGDVGHVAPPDVADINIGGLPLKQYTYTGTVSPGKYDVIATYCTEGEKNCEDPFSEAKYTNIVFNLTCDIDKSSKADCNNLFNNIISTFRFTK